MNVRVASAQVIAAVLRGEASLNTLIPRFMERVPANDRPLLQEFCYGTLRWFPTLEVILSSLMDKPIKAKDAEITALLATGLYQLREMRTPDHAAVNESVAACKGLKRIWAKGLVNAVLRNYQREHERREKQWQQNPVYNSAHPHWLLDKLHAAWPQQAEDITTANNQRPPMTLRVNTAKASRDHYLALLAEAAIGARPASFAATGIYLENPVAVDQLPGFADGWVSVQDEASQLCAPLLHPMPGHRVLDACCAPGGKTCHILETEPGLSELVALDIDAGRLDKVRQNLSRLNLSATLTAADASDLGAWWDGRPFDRILLDAPCSATGVIRRHPDIKLLRTPADIDKLGEIQHKLLSTLWATLKPGGKLLYTTCSVLPEENDQVIATFLQNKGDCLPQPLSLVTGIATPYGHQLLPCPNGNDGFYYSLLQKTGATPGESS